MDFATALSTLGLLALYRRNPSGAILCATILVAFPAVYYTVLASDRYRLPIMWVTFGLAAAGLAWLFQFFAQLLLNRSDVQTFGGGSAAGRAAAS